MDQRDQYLHQMLGKTVHIVVDRPIGQIHGDLVYPVNYGYIPGMLAGDGEEQDAYILGVSQPLQEFDAQVIGAIRRRNDAEDKLVTAPTGTVLDQAQIAQAVAFQEQFFDSYVISLLRRSCGVLPYRIENAQREYLIVFEQYSQCWSLPKGHMEPGETPAQTALRELWEETGLHAQLDTAHSASIEYPLSPVSRKQVIFYPGLVSGIPRVRPGEILRYKWITAQQLQEYLFSDTAAACEALIAAMDQ